MTSIRSAHARELLDSRGNPTLEVELELADGSLGRAIVPSGASTGENEALELRDGDPKRYLGKGVLSAVRNVDAVFQKAIAGKSFENIRALDQAMLQLDSSAQKSEFGANTLLGISLAFSQALAVSESRPLFLTLNEQMGRSQKVLSLPAPLMNILNGGLHANNGLEIQEFMIVPHGFERFSEALRAGVEVFHHLKKKLGSLGLSTAVGDEGGFAPSLKNNEQALELIAEAINKAGYQLGKQISLALDVASSSFFDKASGKYKFRFEGKDLLTSTELSGFYAKMLHQYPIVSIEDGLDENDWDGWRGLTAAYGSQLQLVGDDLFVTQKAYVERGIKEKVANAVLIKVNQVGTLSETFDTMDLCYKSGYRTIVSHRSGETEDTTISHLAVGSGCGQIKTGSASRGERTAKYNELLRIEEWGTRNKVHIPFRNVFT